MACTLISFDAISCTYVLQQNIAGLDAMLVNKADLASIEAVRSRKVNLATDSLTNAIFGCIFILNGPEGFA